MNLSLDPQDQGTLDLSEGANEVDINVCVL